MNLSTSERTGVAEAQVSFMPMAGPSVLSLLGFGGATFVVAAHPTGWYGGPNGASYLFGRAGAQPGRVISSPVQYPSGQPGMRVGQY